MPTIKRQKSDGTWEYLQLVGQEHTSSPDVSSLMSRDIHGRSQVAEPSADADIANKGFVATKIHNLVDTTNHPVTGLTTGHVLTASGATAYGFAAPDSDGILYDNAGAHNSIYRGKSLGTEYTQAQSDVIAAGTFADLYIGDYWTIGGVVYRIAAFNYFYNVGDTNLTTNHAVIVPDTSFGNATMEATNITTNGYLGSLMRTTNIATAKTACKAAFEISAVTKVINHRQILCSASAAGLASGWGWADCEVELMNEVMVYGSVAWGIGGGTSGYNVGSSHGRLPLFALRDDLVNIRVAYWLRDVSSATAFAFVFSYGFANALNASNTIGVRPAFSIS